MHAIIPHPLEMEYFPNEFRLTEETAISVDSRSHAAATFLNCSISSALGFELCVRENCVTAGINIVRDASLESLGPEGYELEVTSARIFIRAWAAAGQHYAVQTLRQLLPVEIFKSSHDENTSWVIRCVKIRDRPRFKWRGLMLDTARHMFPVADIKRFIDVMAIHKLNIFHWHIVDDQGWRLEIKRYPKLTEIGSVRSESPSMEDESIGDGMVYGGHYTQDEVREIVEYAAQHFVTVVPEIEMPGHASAAIAAYPEMGNTDIAEYHPAVQTRWGIFPYVFSPSEKTFAFLQDVLTEVMNLFPSRYLHIGGDEVMKDQWKQSASARRVLEQAEAGDERGMQSWFLQKIEKFITGEKRRLVGWDEIQEAGLPRGNIVMIWRDWKWALQAVNAGNEVVMSPRTHCYFDYFQGSPESEPKAPGPCISLEKVYSLEPVPEQIAVGDEEKILGAQANIWTEYIRERSHLDYMTYPRACALSEVTWSAKDARDFQGFLRRLTHHVKRLEYRGIQFRALSNEGRGSKIRPKISVSL